MMRAILWDMDGTLVDSEPAHAASFDDILEELGIELPDDFHASLIGSTLQDVHRSFTKETGHKISFEEWRDKKWSYYQNHVQTLECRDELASLAKSFAKMNVPMAVVSNSTRQEVEFCLSKTGINKYIPVYVSRNDVENGKPEPESYLLGATKLGVDPINCLVVEDSLRGSIAGVRAGMRVLFHPQNKHNPNIPIPKGVDFIPYNEPAKSYIENFVFSDGEL